MGLDDYNTLSSFGNLGDVGIQPSTITNASNTFGNIGNSGFLTKPIAGTGLGLLSSVNAGPNGSMIKTPGLLDYGMGLFGAYNSYNQGKKMYGLQKEALDFSKNQFWANYLMNMDAYRRRINQGNGQLELLSAYHNGQPYNVDEVSAKYNVGNHIVPYGAETGADPVVVPDKYVNPAYTAASQSSFANTNNNVASGADRQANPPATYAQAAKPTAATPTRPEAVRTTSYGPRRPKPITV